MQELIVRWDEVSPVQVWNFAVVDLRIGNLAHSVNVRPLTLRIFQKTKGRKGFDHLPNWSAGLMKRRKCIIVTATKMRDEGKRFWGCGLCGEICIKLYIGVPLDSVQKLTSIKHLPPLFVREISEKAFLQPTWGKGAVSLERHLRKIWEFLVPRRRSRNEDFPKTHYQASLGIPGRCGPRYVQAETEDKVEQQRVILQVHVTGLRQSQKMIISVT